MNKVGIKIKKLSPLLVVLFSLGVYFSFGFVHLGQFHTADEHYWVSDPGCGRIFQYWNAMLKGDWKKTMVNDKPGISLAIVSGAGLFFEENFHKLFDENVSCNGVASVEQTVATALHFRIPILIFNGLFCLYLFWILRKLFKNAWISAWATSLILLSPVLLGISQIVNPDSLLWVFVTASMITFFAYLEYGEKKLLLLTILWTALALLSKYTALILFPYFIVVLFVHYVYMADDWKNETAQNVKKTVLAFIFLCLGSGAVFAMLMPAIFFLNQKANEGFSSVDGLAMIGLMILISLSAFLLDAFFMNSKVLSAVASFVSKYRKYLLGIFCGLLLGVIVFVLLNWMSSRGLVPNLFLVNFDEGKGSNFKSHNLAYRAILEFVPLVFSLQPFVLLMFLYLLVMSALGKIIYSKIVTNLLIFVGIFYIAVLSQGLLVDIRYGIILYPIVMILVAVGIYDMAGRWSWLFKKKILISFFLVGFCILSLWQIKPFYFNYASSLLPSDRLVAGAWGYGGYEAAQYLNGLAGAEKLIVWSDYNGFCQFFVGTCVKGNRDLKNWNKKEGTDGIDYYVKTRRGTIMYADVWEKMGFYGEYVEYDPVWSMNIDNRPSNYIKIYEN